MPGYVTAIFNSLINSSLRKKSERKLPKVDVDSKPRDLSQLLNYIEAFEQEISRTSLTPNDVTALAKKASNTANVEAINVLAKHYPEVINSETISEMMPTDGDGRDAFTYSLLEVEAKSELAPALRSMCSAKPKEKVTTVFSDRDVCSIRAYIEGLRKTPIRIGSFIIRGGEKDAAGTAIFAIANGKIKPENSIAEQISREKLDDPDEIFDISYSSFPGFL